MHTPDLALLTLTIAATALHRCRISSIELTQSALDRAKDLNPRIAAMTEITAVSALREAKRIDRKRASGAKLGRLAGIPLAIKDIIDTTPAVCSAGLSFLDDYRPAEDADVVRRLRRAGGVVVGVTATDPGAFGVRTPAVTHPQAPGCTVGGSSGGSAAALAAGFCLGSLGTDTGGSIRIPSACCATAGLKPTRGRVSLQGIRPLVWSLDHVGPMARRVTDLEVLQVVLDPQYARTRGPQKRRPTVGYDPTYSADADPQVQAGLETALAACRDLGARVQPVALPTPEEALHIHGIIFCAESAAYHRAEFPDKLDHYTPLIRQIFGMAERSSGVDYVQAIRTRDAITQRVDVLFDKVDFVLAPSIPVLPPAVDAQTVTLANKSHDYTLAMVRYTCLFDHTGHPAVAMPAMIVTDGLATSIQVIGRRHRDADVLAFAVRLEQALDLSINYPMRA